MTKEFKEKPVSRTTKLALSLGAGLLLALGLLVGLFVEVSVGVVLFALGTILLAVRGYLNTGDKPVAGALIFVALAAIGIQAIVYFLGP